MSPGFSLGLSLFAKLLVTGLLRMQISDLKSRDNQTPFLLISSPATFST